MVNDQEARLDATFAALAHPARRAMLARLARDQSSPGDLAAPFDVSLPAVSRHLRVLERAGLIARRREGRRHHLALVPGPLEEVTAWIAHHRAFWERQLDSLERFLDQTLEKEHPSWQTRTPRPRSRSASSAPSRIRASTSSTRGPTRRR